jgi:hypothetical protein
MKVEIIDPTRFLGWDELLLSTPGYSFFHSSAWARVLAESYGYTPLYFTVLEDGKLRALVPLMEVNSILTGKRGVSLPFTDYCEPIIDEDVSFQDLFKKIIEFGKSSGWKYVGLRGGDKYLSPESCFLALGSLVDNPSRLPHILHPTPCPFTIYLGHTLDLSKGEEEIFSNFRDSTRRNIKKASSHGVVVKIYNDLAAVKEFCRLNSMTRKIHGLPPQPFCFFQKVYDHIISKGAGFVALALHSDRAVAGAIFFHFGGKAIFKYSASDPKYLNLRVNNLIMWKGISWFRQNGYEKLCFGRTELENPGLRQYKMGWGTEEKTLPYFKFDLQKMEFTIHHNKRSALSSKIFQRIPIPALNLTGSILYRHMG